MRRKSIKKIAKKDRFKFIKIASVPVLLAALVFVIIGNPTAAPGQKLPNSLAARGEPAQAEDTGSHSSRSSSSAAIDRSWPDVELDFLDGPNPFSSYLVRQTAEEPTQLVSAGEKTESSTASDSVAEIARELVDQPVNYVFDSGRRKLMMVGQRMLEKGEYWSETVQIHEIRPGNLILSIHPADAGRLDATNGTR